MIKPAYFIRKVTNNGKLGKNIFRGYEGHYLMIIPLKATTQRQMESLRASCRQKLNYCDFDFLGNHCRIMAKGIAPQLRPLIPIIKNKVLNDCIAHPSKYLWDEEKED